MSGETPRCLKDQRIDKLAEAMKALSDPTRIRILCFLKDGEACVCDIEEHLEISQQLTSHHLIVMREAGLVHMRKDGTRSLYSIDVDTLKTVNETFDEYADWKKVKVGVQQIKAC